MNDGRTSPPANIHIPELRQALPVLTEVIEDNSVLDASKPQMTPQVDVAKVLAKDPLDATLHAMDEERITRDVLFHLQGQVDRMFEFRLKSTLEPLLQGLVTDMVRQAREELAVVMTDVVKRAVSQELAKRKPR